MSTESQSIARKQQNLDNWFLNRFALQHKKKVVISDDVKEEQKSKSFGEIKRELEERLANRRKEERQLRYSVYNAENEIEDDKENEEDEEMEEEFTDEEEDGERLDEEECEEKDSQKDEGSVVGKDSASYEDKIGEPNEGDVEEQEDEEEKENENVFIDSMAEKLESDGESSDSEETEGSESSEGSAIEEIRKITQDSTSLQDNEYMPFDHVPLDEKINFAKVTHDEVLENAIPLCSGIFDQPTIEGKNCDTNNLLKEIDHENDEFEVPFKSNKRKRNPQLITSDDEDEEANEKQIKLDGNPMEFTAMDDLFTAEDEMDEDVGAANLRNTLVKVITTDEDDEENGQQEEYEMEEEEYDDDELLEYEAAIGQDQQQKVTELIDDEASLSGDDAGFDDEDFDRENMDNDEYEPEEGDNDKNLNEEEIREDLIKQFMKYQRDKDDRNVRDIQEYLFADGELHGIGGNIDKNFRIRMRGNSEKDIDWAKILGDFAATQDNDKEEDEDADLKELQESRIEKAKWQLEQNIANRGANHIHLNERAEEEEDGLLLDVEGSLFEFGEQFLAKRKDSQLQGKKARNKISESAVVQEELTLTSFTSMNTNHRDSLLQKSEQLKLVLNESSKSIKGPIKHVLFTVEHAKNM